jgi:hypothetical protein
MTRTWFPEAHYMPDMGQYRPMYRWYRENPWRLVPGEARYPTAGRAIAAAKDWLASRLNSHPGEGAPEPANDDPLGVAAWREERAGRAAQDQQQALGAIIVKGKQVQVEKRRIA